jgi:hypothetical protein
MGAIILRDSAVARKYLLQGLWFQRAVPPSAATVTSALTWSLAIADGGQPLPPTGLVADIGHAALGNERDRRSLQETLAIPGWSSGSARTYEDLVLGKLYADWTFERASDALKRIELAKQPLGLAYIIKQVRERGQLGGAEFSPGIIRGLLTDAKPEENLRLGWDMLVQEGPLPLLLDLYGQAIAACRRMAEALALEDVIALEQKTALLSMSEYVAHRQLLQMSARLEECLPRHKLKPLSRRQEVPTRMLDEDTYPVGGFSAISTRGSIESLLHSQLAYMEKEKERQPDLFDIKYVRDELYYYSRDENQFLRRRRSFLFLLHPDLALARFKDAELPCQRLVLALALFLTAVRKLSEWLGDDSLHFEFAFVQDNGRQPLAEEMKLLRLLFREQIENGAVAVVSLPAEEVERTIQQLARRSLCRCLLVSSNGWDLTSDAAAIAAMRTAGPTPELRTTAEEQAPESESPFDAWSHALLRLLQEWV